MPYLVLDHKAHRVCALTAVGETWTVKCPAVDFLKTQSIQKNYAASCRGMAVIFGRYASGGRQAVTVEMFHEVDKKNGIWEFIKGDLRVLCFVDGNNVYLTNGYIKKGQKADASEVARAVSSKKEFLEK